MPETMTLTPSNCGSWASVGAPRPKFWEAPGPRSCRRVACRITSQEWDELVVDRLVASKYSDANHRTSSPRTSRGTTTARTYFLCSFDERLRTIHAPIVFSSATFYLACGRRFG